MATIENMLRRSGGIAAGVPLLRHALALTMLLSGAIQVNARFVTLRQSLLGIIILGAPTMLLAVTGFLLARSAERRGTNLGGTNLALRYAIRLFPPLVISLLVTIVALGLLVSNISRRRYFGAAETWRYLANAGGWSSSTLPGVFEFNNASATVNAALWIVPVTVLGCVLAVLASRVPTAARRGLFVAGLLAVVGWVAAIELGSIDQYSLPRGLRPLADGQVIAAAAGLLLGMLAYAFRQHLPARALPFALAVAVIGGAAIFPQYWVGDAVAQTALAVPLAYVAVVLAVAWLPTPWPLGRVNYSVGIVLYAYPVEQACIALRGTGQSLLVTLLVSAPVTIVLAAASWHLIERPLLARMRPQPVLSMSDGTVQARPVRWYVARASAVLPTLAMVVLFSAIALALLAVAMFALQRDQPGM